MTKCDFPFIISAFPWIFGNSCDELLALCSVKEIGTRDLLTFACHPFMAIWSILEEEYYFRPTSQ